MTSSREDLVAHYHRLEDDVLLSRYESGTLTELAQSVVRDELRRRGLTERGRVPETEEAAEGTPGDLKPIAGHLTWGEAHVLCSLLEAEGIPAAPADAHMALANSVLSAATGGVRVLVHEQNMARALEIKAALQRGDYSISEDFDVRKT